MLASSNENWLNLIGTLTRIFAGLDRRWPRHGAAACIGGRGLGGGFGSLSLFHRGSRSGGQPIVGIGGRLIRPFCIHLRHGTGGFTGRLAFFRGLLCRCSEANQQRKRKRNEWRFHRKRFRFVAMITPLNASGLKFRPECILAT